MQRIAKMSGSHLRVFPDVTFVRIRGGKGEPDLAYSLIRNKAYTNVSSLLDDASQRDAEDLEGDTLTVLNWLEGCLSQLFLWRRSCRYRCFRRPLYIDSQSGRL